MKFNFNIIILFLTTLICVRGENNEYIENKPITNDSKTIPIITTTEDVLIFTTTTETSIPTTENITTASINNIDNDNIDNALYTPPLHYSDNIQICPKKKNYSDVCNEKCEVFYLYPHSIHIENSTDDASQYPDYLNAITYCAMHEKYDDDKMECVEDENLLKFYKHLCSLRGYIYDLNLSACILSTPYNETEGCLNGDYCGKAWIEESDDHINKICKTKHRASDDLLIFMPCKTKEHYNHQECKNECLVNFFTGEGTGNSYDVGDIYYGECYCTISEPAPLCNEECISTQTYTFNQFHDHSWDKTLDNSIKFSLQFTDNENDLEWCVCPSPAELKYIVKAEEPECCSGDECLNSSLLKCCSDSKAFIHKNHIYYGIEDEERCIWPSEKKIPELVTIPAKALPKPPFTLVPAGGNGETKQITTGKQINSSKTIPDITSNDVSISNAKTIPIATTSDIVSTPTVPNSSSENGTILMTIPKKKVVKVTKKVTEKVTKKVTVKVTKKKNSTQ